MAVKSRMSLDEFLAEAGKHRSWLFNAHQRLYASILKYGKTISKINEGKKDSKSTEDKTISTWNFIYKQPNDTRQISELYGLDDIADSFVTILKRGTQNPAERSKLIEFIGPAAVGKSEFEKILSETLKDYTSSEEGLQYRVKLHLDDKSLQALRNQFDSQEDFNAFKNEVRATFKGLTDVKLAPATNVQTALYLFLKRDDGKNTPTRVDSLVEDLNKDVKDRWQTVRIDSSAVSSSVSWTKSKIVDALSGIFRTKEDAPDMDRIYQVLEKMVSVDRASESEVLITAKPNVAVGEKNFSFNLVFGGKRDYGLMNKLEGDDSNPLVYGYGVAGGQKLPSPAGNILLFSEVLKAPESFVKPVLDFIQDREVRFADAYREPVDAVLIGTTNLDEYAQLSSTVKDYFMSRTYNLLFKSMTNLNAAERALDHIFQQASSELGFHYSPRFIKLMEYLWVMSALDEAPNVSLKQKADIYAGKRIPDVKITLEEMLKNANSKSLLEVEEGVKRGIPYREMAGSIVKFLKYAKAVQSDLVKKPIEEQDVCLDAMFGGDNSMTYLEMFLNTMEGITDDTKRRIRGEVGTKVMGLAFDVYRRAIEEDVANCYLSDNAVSEHVKKYVLHKYHQKQEHEKFSYDGRFENVDKDFLKNIEEKSGVKGDVMGSTITSIIRTKYYGEINENSLKDITDALLEDHPTLVKAVIDLLRPQRGMVLASSQDNIKAKLTEKYGYCQRKGGCADVAYHLFDSRT